MKSHKYWAMGAIVAMIGAFYTGYKGPRKPHKYLAFASLICMLMSIYSGYQMGVRKKLRR